MISYKTDEVIIIIVTYNAMSWLATCLEKTKPYSVIVVDNNSSDGTVEYIKSDYPQMLLIEQKENLGFGRANNIGISQALKAGAEHVFLLNQDAYLTEDCIEVLIKIQKSNGIYGVLSPIHLNDKGDRLDENFSQYVTFHSNKNFYSDHILKKKLSTVYQVPFVNAAGWLISRECLMTVGGFDPLFFHYGEDDNYCQRVKYHGFKVGVVPGTFLKHDRKYSSISKHPKSGFDHLKKLEWTTKVHYADINSPKLSQLRRQIKRREKSAIISYLQFNTRAGGYYKAEVKVLKKIYPEIEKSLSRNRRKGSLYLDVE